MRVNNKLIISGFIGLLILIFMFGVLHMDNERILKEKRASEGKENEAKQIAVAAKAVHEEPIYSEPELQMSELMLQPRSRIEAKLGHPMSPAVECADTRGKQYEYADGSYLCTDRGLVVLFSYVLRKPVASADAALKAVGLHADAPAFTILDVIHIWSHQHNNPIMVGKKYANQITVMIGVPPKRVEVAME
jgi:hypothetical protein